MKGQLPIIQPRLEDPLPDDPPPLRSIPTGELAPDAPSYASLLAEHEALQREHAELNRKYLGALSQIGKYRADRAAEARAHEFWTLATVVFMEWKIATGANRPSGINNSKWTEERFWVVHPFLKVDGFPPCRAAVWGIAAEPNVKRITPAYTEVYDSFELAFRDRPTFERYANRGAAVFGMEWLSQ